MEKIKQLLNQYDVGLLFATNKEYDIRSIHRELDIKTQFIQKVKEIIEEENAKGIEVKNCTCEIIETKENKCVKIKDCGCEANEHEFINIVTYDFKSNTITLNHKYHFTMSYCKYELFVELFCNKTITIKEFKKLYVN